jgi:hypothetical protein
MHIVENLISLSSTLSQTASQLLDGQHSQPWCQREQQQQCQQPTSTTNTCASVDNASSDVADHATNYGQHAASPRTSTSTTAVTPTFYKNKFFFHIGVHTKCISNCSADEKHSKNKSCIGSIAWHGILYFSKILEEPRRI